MAAPDPCRPPGTLSTRLDNGLTVLVAESRTVPLVSVWCWYKVGSRDEPPGQSGVSHWVEHMNFKGTARIPREEMKHLVEREGGTWNGYTWIDQTAYFATAPADALDRLLFLEAERMHAGLYDPRECESERTVILSELHGGDNDPETMLDTEVTATAFRVHPYGHPTIGWAQDVEAMGREHLYAHYRRYYRPNNATLVIAGDVAGSEAVRLAAARFDGIAPAPVTRSAIVEPPQVAERRVSLRRSGTTSYLRVAYHAPAVSDPDFPVVLLLDAVLTGGKGLNLWSSFGRPAPQRRARLYRRLVESRLASEVRGALLPTEQPFLYTLSVTVGYGTDPGEVEAALLDEIAGVVRGEVTDDELDRARRQLRTRLLFDVDGVTNVAHQIGYFDTIGAPRALEALGIGVDAVTIDDIVRVGARRLDERGRTVGWFLPERSPARSRASEPGA